MVFRSRSCSGGGPEPRISASGTFRAVRLGADSGGTFTDVVGTDGRILKIPSTPHDPGAAVREGIERLAGRRVRTCWRTGPPSRPTRCWSGPGAVVALVTTDGLRRRRGDRSTGSAVALRPVARPGRAPLVARALRQEVRERLDATGAVLVPLELASLPSMPDGVESVAVCLLHADLDPVHERAVAAALRAAGHDVSVSHEVAPEFREYERTVHHGRQRLPPPGLSALPGGAGRRGRLRGGDDLGGRPRRRRHRRRDARRRCCCRVRPAGCGPPPPWPRHAATPTPSASTWVARAPTSA